MLRYKYVACIVKLSARWELSKADPAVTLSPVNGRLFERKVLRKIFGPTKERDGTWRIKANEELDKLIRRKNIINYIKSQRLS
jgi:hypothetical protein